ncbi:glycosyltransferase family 25 protein [Dyadobacter sp. CY347]|uniref:glycosyltransferase family 25 protein n=1 Tax=Dyadobacter sp. CY347 TaxID=2909336 RepID=UPI001F48E809|nr:glycosyltransferase family 25 protein [Dyadobacter sp. CY347]MCF2487519.1 glycosyltransferase family 25 protein [Dyadobacter sp. CY347]
MRLDILNQITSIHYINLLSNAKRRVLIKNLLSQFPYDLTHIQGVIFDNSNPKFKKYLNAGVEAYVQNHVHQKGIIGCWIAHTHALEVIPVDRIGITVVLEDDFVCASNFFLFALEQINRFKRSFDIFICDPWGKGPLSEHAVEKNIYQPRKCNYPYYSGAHCLFINSGSAPKILQLIGTTPIKDYDGFLIDNENLDVYLLYTGLSGVRDLKSDIRG